MTFSDLVAALSKEFGMEIEIENDACAVRASATTATHRWKSATRPPRLRPASSPSPGKCR